MKLRIEYRKELKKINKLMVEMVNSTEQAIEDTILALDNRDMSLARKVSENDKQINLMQAEIEKKCTQVIAIHQPVAGDLRSLISILKMATDVERIGDHAVDICNLLLQADSEGENLVWDIKPLHDMSHTIINMLHASMDAFAKQDLELARSIRSMDKDVNKKFNQSLKDVRKLMENNPKTVKQGIIFLQVSKYFERIGDHCKNLSEWVIYSITGEYVLDQYREPEKANEKVDDVKISSGEEVVYKDNE